MRAGQRTLGIVAAALVGAAGCGTADSLEPDRGPRPALTTDATPEAPEPDQEITDPSPDEGLTTTVPEQREEAPPAEPEPEPEPTTAAPPPATEPANPEDEAMAAFCEAAEEWSDYWDDQMRDLCAPYAGG